MIFSSNRIATLLHVDLGEHDQSEAKAANETTDAEKFHSYRDVRTVGWHIRRDVVAQRCKLFVYSNR